MSKRWSVGLLGLLLLFLAACSQTVQTPTPGAEENLAVQACTRTWPTVKRSSSYQSNAKVVQYLLRNRGYSLTVDGYFGSGTESTVKSFQRSKGLSQDGIVGTNTWSALIATVQQGSNNNAVRAVQFKLGISVDGIFGSGTKSSVVNFQRSKGLSQDGIVGPNTWAALVGGSVNCSGGGGSSGTYSLPIPKSTLPRGEYDDPHHDYPAIDLPTPTGTSAFAMTAGTISHIGGSCGYGILITASNGATYKYCHLNSRSVGSGARVSAGQRIGYTGNTGNSFGPHLHLEVRASAGAALRCPQRMLLAIYDGTSVPSPSSLPTSGCSY